MSEENTMTDETDVFSPAGDSSAEGGQAQGQQAGEGQTTQQGAQGQQQQQQGQQPAAGLTADEIALAIKKAGLGGQSQQQQAPQKQYTEQDFEKMFNVFRVSPDFVAKLRSDNPEEVVGVLQSISDGINKQAVTLASYMIKQVEDRLAGQVGPLAEYINQQKTQALTEEFYKANDDLRPYGSLVDAVVNQMKANGYAPPDKQTAFKDVARQVRDMVSKFKSNGANGQAQTQQQSSTAAGVMPQIQSGGQGGVGGGSRGGGQSNKPAGLEVFD